MTKKKIINNHSLPVTRITRTMFFLCLVLAANVIVFDSGNLLARESVIDRWLLISGLLLVFMFSWFIVGVKNTKSPVYSRWFVALISVSLLVASGYLTYWERGMASTSTIFYVLPVLVAATLKNRHAILASASLSAATYALSAVLYFNTNFNEGYRIQLWGSILLYSGIIFVSAWLVMIVAGLRKDSL